MKRMSVRFAFILALVMILSTHGVGSAESVSLPADNPEKNVEFTIWSYADDYKHYTSYEENPVVLYLNKLLNVTMRFQLPAMGAEAENFSLMLGTGDYTEVMNVTFASDSMQALYEDGVIIDIAPYLKDYMPNYNRLLQENDELRKLVYDDEGRAFGIYTLENIERNQWGGLVYRRDILDTMTGGNVVFPSGNDEPTTVEDLEYMLPLMKAYFDASGIPETASLIIPASGYVVTGELLAGFGTSGTFYLDTEAKHVLFGPAQEGFYNYTQKMKEWFQAGYVYPDFASRTNDMFYLPNPALTYGGSAGVWFGLLEQAGTAMSLPDYGLNMMVLPLAAPLDTQNGITPEQAGIYIFNGIATNPHCISTTCDTDKIARILTVMDYMFSTEGGMLFSHGLNAQQAKDDALYTSLGLEGGTYWLDDKGGLYTPDKVQNADKENIKLFSLQGGRLPGKPAPIQDVLNDVETENSQYQDLAGKTWVKYGRDRVMPSGATRNAQENKAYSTYITGIYDYVNSMIPRFIMGTEELNETTWKQYIEQLNNLGLGEVMEAQQSAYDRYLAR